jgi:hypothetical protein
LTSLGILGKIALAEHLKRNPGHVGNEPDASAIGVKEYVCQTCGYPIMSAAEWAKSTGMPLAERK